jgi:hypothetical protein
LTSVVIPEGVETIGNYAFSSCSGITSVSIPSTCETIGDYAFSGLKNLAKVYNYRANPQSISSNVFSNTSGKLYVGVNSYEAYSTADVWKNFGSIINELEVTATLTLTDGYAYTSTSDAVYDVVNYVRNFSNTSWQGLYIPFSVSYEDWSEDFDIGYVNGVHMYDSDDDGELDESEIEIVKMKEGMFTYANTPYFIRAKKKGTHTLSVNKSTTVYAAADNSIDCSTTTVKFVITGTSFGVDGETMYNNKYYALVGGGLKYAASTSATLKPFRWYMDIVDRDVDIIGENSSALANIRIVCLDDEEANAIDTVTSNAQTDDAVYTLDGRRVSSDNLKAGIYIKNGKKYLVK